MNGDAAIVMATIEAEPDALPPWATAARFSAPLAGLGDRPPSGRARAWRIVSGERVPLIVESDGAVACGFDVRSTVDVIREERYPGAVLTSSITARLPFDYQRLPMPVIGLAHRALTRSVPLDPPRFPAFPLDLTADVLAQLAGRGPHPTWAPERAPVALTHDVDGPWLFDSAAGRRWLERYLAAEERRGMRSSWYCVAGRMGSESSRAALRDLAARGHEIGVHGLTHDAAGPYRDARRLEDDLTRARDALGEHGGVGYRSPWLSRSPALFRALADAGFAYDTSVPTTDVQRRGDVTNNGCCTARPFERDGIVEIPITLPQDASRRIWGLDPQAFWESLARLAARIASAGGVTVVSTHLQPHHSANEEMFRGYEDLLDRIDASRVALARHIAKEIPPR